MSEKEILQILSMILALMVAIIGHEIMHGVAAKRYGDDTAKNEGRLSINPIKHIDPIGTILVPAILFFASAPFLFGWAKPVPVNISKVIQNGGYFGAIVVALAGIAFNFSLALGAAFTLGIVDLQSGIDVFIAYFLVNLVIYNIVLGIFNLWPIPPLDGSQALGYLSLWFGNRTIPQFFNKIERYGMIILIAILATPLSAIFFMPVAYIVNLLLS